MNNALAEPFLGEPIKPLDGGEILRKAGCLEFWVGAPQIVPLEGRVRPHAPRKKSPAQRAIAECRDAVLAAVRQEVGFDSALEQIVRRLQHVKRCHATKLFDLLDGKIAYADRADLSLVEQHVHRVRRLFDRNQRVGPVDLIDVDVIGSKPAQGILDLAHDAGAAGIAENLLVLPLESRLGGDQDTRAQAGFGDRFADDLLGTAEAISGRGIDQVDAVIQRGANRGNGFRFVGPAPHPPADRPRADGDAGHFDRCARDAGKLSLNIESLWLKGHDSVPSFVCPCLDGDLQLSDRGSTWRPASCSANEAEGGPVETGIAARDSGREPIAYHLNRRHGHAVAFRFGKGQANILQRERHDESGRICLADHLVAVNSVRAPAKHRARHDIDEWLWIQPSFDE